MAVIMDMGGFGGFVWTSYGIAALCLGWLTYASWQSEKIAAKRLADLEEIQRDKNS
jgi:heme exporter protein CcmD